MLLDERFWAHRYKATSHAAVVGAAVAAGWFTSEVLLHGRIRWDLLSVLAAMALTKVVAMVYFRLRD